MAIRNFAQETYRSDAEQVRVPRQKFQFTLGFSIYDGTYTIIDRVASVTTPSFNFDTMIANQYNNKRVVQTKMNYSPITISFYDTYDSEWFRILRRYIKHYYNDNLGIEQTDLHVGVSTINDVLSSDAGYTPTSDRNFFTDIRIVQPGHNDFIRTTVLKNPLITDIVGDTLDYSDSNPAMLTVTFQPEKVQVYYDGDFSDDVTVYTYRDE